MAAHAFCIFVKDPAGVKAGSEDAHLQWIRQLRTQPKLAAASPVENDPQMASIAIFKSGSLEDANELVGEDEAAKSGELQAELYLWWSANRVLPWREM
jgi:uncharacterized protein YciI